MIDLLRAIGPPLPGRGRSLRIGRRVSKSKGGITQSFQRCAVTTCGIRRAARTLSPPPPSLKLVHSPQPQSPSLQEERNTRTAIDPIEIFAANQSNLKVRKWKTQAGRRIDCPWRWRLSEGEPFHVVRMAQHDTRLEVEVRTLLTHAHGLNPA